MECKMKNMYGGSTATVALFPFIEMTLVFVCVFFSDSESDTG